MENTKYKTEEEKEGTTYEEVQKNEEKRNDAEGIKEKKEEDRRRK
jgi:hypothetical protein